MLARFRILLPFDVSLKQGDELPPEEFSVGDYRVRVHPPHQAAATRSVLEDPQTTPYKAALSLAPAEYPSVDSSVTIDGQPTILANVVQIDVEKPTFDRRKLADNGLINTGDPPISFFFDSLNSVLSRLRSVGRAGNLHTLHPHDAIWRLDYLDDAGERPPRSEDNVRSRGGLRISIRLTAVWGSFWRAAIALPRDYKPPAWESLLLDAQALLPDIIPAIVLAAAAMETLIGTSIELLAPKAGLDGALWTFIIDREGDYRKQPSVGEEFDKLLLALTGHSLKERQDLWTAFKQLRGARNTLMHQGVMLINNRPITNEQAHELIGKAGETAAWIEQWLPEAARRPPAPSGLIEVQRRMVNAVDIPE